MDTEINKFAQISDIYSQFTEKNKNMLIRTALSLLHIQHVNEAMIASGFEHAITGKHGKENKLPVRQE